MPAIDFIPTTPESARPSDRGLSAPKQAPKPGAEQFDAVMGRALAHSTRRSTGDSDSSDEPPRGDKAVNRTKKSEPDKAAPMDASAAAEAATPPPPERNESTSSVPPRSAAGSDAGPATAPVSAGQAPGSNAATAIAAAAGENADAESVAVEESLTEELAALSGTDPAESAAPAVPPATVPTNGEATGISSAKQQVPMQQAENMNKFSGSTEQKLPAAAAIAGEDLPARTPRPANFKLPEDKSVTSADQPSALTSPSAATEAGPAGAVSAEWPLPVRSVERTHDLMALHAMRLRDSGSDSLQVVIKPDAGLQLSLNLQMRNGNMEMSAQLNRGNYDLLNLHWPELQQQLEARGIRLAPLTNEHSSTQGGGDPSQHPGRHPAQERASAGAFAEFALNSTLVPAPTVKTRTSAPRGWESWA